MYKIVDNYGNYEPEEYESLDEAQWALDEIRSNFQTGSELLFLSNPGDYEEECDEDVDYFIVRTDEYGNELERYDE